MPDPLAYALDQARRLEEAEDEAYEALLNAVPATAWPDANQTTYRIVTQPLPYTSAVACYDADVVSEATADYGSRLLGALRDARRSLKPSSGEPLVDQHAVALETIARDPGRFTVHFLGGVLTALESMVVAVGRLALQATELIADVVVCSAEGVASDLRSSVQDWLSGGDEPDWPTGSLECVIFEAQARQTFEGLVVRARSLDALADDPAALVDAGVATAAHFYEILAALRLGDRYAVIVRDPAALGALVGVVTGELAIFLVPYGASARAGRVAVVEAEITAAATEIAATDLQVIAAKALSEASEASVAGRMSALATTVSGTESAVSNAVVVDAAQAAGAQARAILADSDLSHIESFGRNGGVGLTNLIDRTPAAALVQALTRAMESLGAATRILVGRVRPYRDLRRELSALNASQRLVIATDAVALAGADTQAAANLALLQQEDALLEAAHLIDARFIGAGAPTAVGADLAAVGVSSPQTAPAFAALRATHRTTTARLRSLGAPLPEITGETVTQRMMSALPIKQSREGALLVVDDATRGWEVVPAHFRTYASSPISRHPAWPAMQEELFAVQKALLDGLRGTDPALFGTVRDAWPEFASWLTKNPY